jgi:hypothetical protein
MENYVMFVDTETANEIDHPLCYDISFAVADLNGNIKASYSYVVAEIFCDEKELMKNCYFAEKIPIYEKALKDKTKTLKSIYNIRKVFRRVCREYNIKTIVAHNSIFDYNSLNMTLRYITKSKHRFFLPYGVEIWDTLKMSRQIFAKDENYIKFCNDNNYLTSYKKPRLTAEVLYKYISNDNNFIEEHIGIEDIKIETKILAECLKINPNIEKKLF